MSDCIFCKIIRKEIPSEVVWEDESVLAFRDLSPQAPTHVLIIPKKHIPSLAESTPEDEALLGHLHSVARSVAEHEGLESGFRLVVNTGAGAGQVVFHVHFHLLGGRSFGWPPG